MKHSPVRDENLQVLGVPTSMQTQRECERLGIPLTTLVQHPVLDLAFDGADQVDDDLQCIKGYGGALLREKIVASASQRLVILVGPEKLVPRLGTRGKLPVEVVPFGLSLCQRRLREFGCDSQLRNDAEGRPYRTDNDNLILDCKVSPIEQPGEFDAAIRALPGVVGTGLFVGLAHDVIVQDGERAELRQRPPSRP